MDGAAFTESNFSVFMMVDQVVRNIWNLFFCLPFPFIAAFERLTFPEEEEEEKKMIRREADIECAVLWHEKKKMRRKKHTHTSNYKGWSIVNIRCIIIVGIFGKQRISQDLFNGWFKSFAHFLCVCTPSIRDACMLYRDNNTPIHRHFYESKKIGLGPFFYSISQSRDSRSWAVNIALKWDHMQTFIPSNPNLNWDLKFR